MITNSIVHDLENNLNFENIISLGHFCAPAMQMDKYGFRDHSYPFDWLIFANFEKMINLIRNQYIDNDIFFDINQYSQGINNRNHYRNDFYNARFLHDFNSYNSLEKQFPKFKEKYVRRIKRFYDQIKNPTLFIRYISSQDEMNYIMTNLFYIEETIKSFCDKNEILFISNKDIITSLDIVFTDNTKYESSMNFSFIDDNLELLNFLKNVYDKEKIEKNLQKRNSHITRKVEHFFERVLPKYKHNKTYVDTD